MNFTLVVEVILFSLCFLTALIYLYLIFKNNQYDNLNEVIKEYQIQTKEVINKLNTGNKKINNLDRKINFYKKRLKER
jgi:hypothetical protein